MITAQFDCCLVGEEHVKQLLGARSGQFMLSLYFFETTNNCVSLETLLKNLLMRQSNLGKHVISENRARKGIQDGVTLTTSWTVFMYFIGP